MANKNVTGVIKQATISDGSETLQLGSSSRLRIQFVFLDDDNMVRAEGTELPLGSRRETLIVALKGLVASVNDQAGGKLTKIVLSGDEGKVSVDAGETGTITLPITLPNGQTKEESHSITPGPSRSQVASGITNLISRL